MLAKKINLAVLAAIIFLVGFFYFNDDWQIKEAKAATIAGSSFSATNYTLSATGASYTSVFTLTSALSSATSDYIRAGTAGLVGGATVGASFCDATFGSISLASNPAGGSFNNSFTISQTNNGRCEDVIITVASGTVSAGAVVTLVVNNVTNPVASGGYYPNISDNKSNYTTAQTMPAQAFGSPLLKVKLTEPDGTTGVVGATVWVYSSNYTKSAGTTTTAGGMAFLFSSNFSVPPGVSVNDTYKIETYSPSTSSYTNATTITNVSLASGSTVDYTQAPLGPIGLSRPLFKGRLKVPSGCTTCTAAAGSVVANVGVDVRDSSFSYGSFKHTNTDSSGIFKMGGLSAGTYTIELRMPYDQQNYLGLIEPAAITNFVVNANGSVTYNSTTTAAASLPVDFGDIEFRLAAKTITGRVTKTDGSAVNNVRIRAFKMKDPGMAQTTTNSSGNYTLTVGGGTWMIMPEIDWYSNFDNNSGNDTTSDWVYCGRPKNVTFVENTTTESSASNNFEVKIANATITGRVAYPDGTALNGSASVDIFSRDGCGSYASVNYTNGTFSSTVPPGTYNVTVHTWNQDYASPPSITVTVGSQSVDVGTLSLAAKTGTISGRVWADSNANGSYDDGEGVGNMNVETFKMSKKFDEYAGGAGGGPMGGGGDWAMASSSNVTATKGNFTLRVNSGAWVVNVRADPGMMSGGYSSSSVNYIYTGSPVEVNISSASQSSSGNNFRLGIADATIQGRVIDNDTGNTVSGIWGYAFAESSTSFNQGPMMGAGMGGPVNSGSFTLKVPAGSYRIGVDFPSEGSGYTTADMATVTAVSGATANVDVRVKPNNATVRVQFKNTSGSLITDLNYAEVFLDNGSGGHQWKHFSSSGLATGLADISVSAGNWRVGYNIDPTTSNYMSEPTTSNQVTAVANQTVTKDITLRAADSQVSGTVYGPSGNPLPGVWISTDSRKASSFSGSGRPMFMQGKTTGTDGTYSLTLPSGTYQVAAFFPPEAVVSGQTVNYLNPDPREVTISPTSSATANFTFKQSDATLSGSITLGGQAQGAFVSAYSDAGGYNETTSTSGSYSLAITKNTTWYIRAMYESGNTFYLSSVYEVSVGSSGSKTQNLTLASAGFTIPDAVSTTFNCANAKKISLSNGTEISIPASAIAPSSVSSCSSSDSSSNITITVTPTAQMSLQNKSIPIGIGYEITAKDTNGSTISTTFNSNVTITIPYTTTEMQDAVGGVVDESLLNDGYWDTATSAWRDVTGEVLDTENNKLTISTNHFTLYGVLAATTPSTTISSSSSSSSGSDGDGVSIVKLNLAKISASPYQSTRSSYVHNKGNIKISGTASQDSKIKITLDNKKKKAFYAGPGSKWDYIIFSPKPGKSYNFKIYAENEEAEVKSKTYSFAVKVAGSSTVKKPSSAAKKIIQTQSNSAISSSFKDCGQKYIVAAGDNLWWIASKQLGRGALYTALIDFNSGLTANSILSIGRVLNIPCSN